MTLAERRAIKRLIKIQEQAIIDSAKDWLLNIHEGPGPDPFERIRGDTHELLALERMLNEEGVG